MPILEYRCEQGHTTEEIFLTFKQAEGAAATKGCSVCGRTSMRVAFSVPFPAHLYGSAGGYHKPSPTKRYSYKLATDEGNKNSVG
jgi:hypothetical protein